MWTQSHSKVYQEVQKKDIWRLWTDVNTWAEWHGDLDFCKMEGPFKVGNHFMLKPKGMSPVKIMLTEVEEGRKFTDCTTFLGAKMYDTHGLEDTPEGLLLTNTVTVTGPLTWLWTRLVARNVARTVPNDMDILVRLARKRADV